MYHWLPEPADETRSPTCRVMTGFAGVGVTVKFTALEVTVTGDTHRSFDVSVTVITSPFAGALIIMLDCPVVPGMSTPFLYQLIIGDEPGLVAVMVTVAVSPEHSSVFGEEMETECVRLGDTAMVIEFEFTVAGVAQPALVVSVARITSLLIRFDSVMLICPAVPGIRNPFFVQVIVGDEPGLVAVKLYVTDSSAQISVALALIEILCVRFELTVMYPGRVIVAVPPGLVTTSVTSYTPGVL